MAFGLTDTDDANEAKKEGADVEVIYPDADGLGTLVMPTAVVLMSGGPNPESGHKLVDYLRAAGPRAGPRRAVLGAPLLVLDMYEHAYHMDLGAAAARYVDAFLENVHWEEVDRRAERARKASRA